eukprot:TRINITY_DN4705_c0_g1_i1.p1 TRINITY_DN4705_c0_g1~~TRINITY_DN4705_c0_g1_i1.p1  ORF type:complete len:349 (+),score=52.67 TRINITY_DN4705_c0_g1_i1:83-1129(+)
MEVGVRKQVRADFFAQMREMSSEVGEVSWFAMRCGLSSEQLERLKSVCLELVKFAYSQQILEWVESKDLSLSSTFSPQIPLSTSLSSLLQTTLSNSNQSTPKSSPCSSPLSRPRSFSENLKQFSLPPLSLTPFSSRDTTRASPGTTSPNNSPMGSPAIPPLHSLDIDEPADEAHRPIKKRDRHGCSTPNDISSSNAHSFPQIVSQSSFDSLSMSQHTLSSSTPSQSPILSIQNRETQIAYSDAYRSNFDHIDGNQGRTQIISPYMTTAASSAELPRKNNVSVGGNGKPGQCVVCKTRNTPEWRKGPDGNKSLCNACGLRFAKMIRKERSNTAACSSGRAKIGINHLVN